jgi:hypothetical protein
MNNYIDSPEWHEWRKYCNRLPFGVKPPTYAQWQAAWPFPRAQEGVKSGAGHDFAGTLGARVPEGYPTPGNGE